MSTEHATEEVPPAVAEDECNQTTTLAVVPEQTSTTIPLERQRIVLEQWEHRRDLHLPTTKSFKLLRLHGVGRSDFLTFLGRVSVT